MARTLPTEPRFPHSSSARKVSLGAQLFFIRPWLRIVNWRKHQRISHPASSRLPSKADGARESLMSRSRASHEDVAKNAESDLSPKQRRAVAANSAVPHEAFTKTSIEAPNGGQPRPFRERLARLFCLSPA